MEKYEKIKRNVFCGERGSNTRPSDLQSDALPTELSPQVALHTPLGSIFVYIAMFQKVFSHTLLVQVVY